MLGSGLEGAAMRRGIVVALMLVSGAALPAAAQDAWQQHTAAGEWAFRQGDHARAEREFRSALEIAQSLPPESRRLDQSLYNLGRLYEETERMGQAQAAYLLLLAAEEHRFGLTAPELLDTLLAVARSSQAVGDVPQAGDSLRRYLAIAEASYQNAVAYARERLQGRAPSGPRTPQREADPIIVHPDVRRMLMTQRALAEGCLQAAG
jgi:tetratricopeptide (TPR) repeat protein